ncbi:SDR family NAD(P)-dependent oxidoreductase [Amycolatopsis anabasis]|uniref:SDR family NAD(P)-dependent oxidoreductase n=1 Tax=Amycolatopsis anabasis TaxID=1840409 RepID=UPI00131D3FEF|nr:SDR family oxidoreductase [Amycolatopsis anabasis]
MAENLAGKHVLVSGASSGIGAAVAAALADEGARVTVVGRRADRLAAVAASIRDAGGVAHGVPADLSDPEAPERIVASAETELGPVDVLVNNAAVARSGPLADLRPRHWNVAVQVNLTAPLRLAQLVVPGMRARGYGWVLNIGSVGGLRPMPRTGPYSVTKSALHFMTAVLDEENRDRGVRAVCLCPGWVRTEMPLDPELAGVPAEALLEPEDLAEAVRWVVTRPARMTLGPIVPVVPSDPRTSVERVWFDRLAQSHA